MPFGQPDALTLAATPPSSPHNPQAVGHSYNLFDINSKRMLNVEVGPGSVMSVLEVTPSQPGPATASWYFHANMYKHLVLQQRTDNSSYHREARALQLQVRASGCRQGKLGGDLQADVCRCTLGASASNDKCICVNAQPRRVLAETMGSRSLSAAGDVSTGVDVLLTSFDHCTAAQPAARMWQ